MDELEKQGNDISPEVLEKTFEPFYTTKEVGQGTSFTIKLPVYKEKFPAFTSEFSNT